MTGRGLGLTSLDGGGAKYGGDYMAIRVTVSMPDEVYAEMEKRRGTIARSSFISAMLHKAIEAQLAL